MEDLRAAGHMTTTGEDSERKMVGGKKEEGLMAPELRLTTGERDVVAAIEEKISKQPFKVTLRFIYLARAEKYMSIGKTVPFAYFQQFNTANLNFIKPLQTTKVYTIKTFFLDKRRAYLRRRRLFRLYSTRDVFSFPGKIRVSFGSDAACGNKKGRSASRIAFGIVYAGNQFFRNNKLSKHGAEVWD